MCRANLQSILLIDLHHMVEVSEGGGNKPSNLLPLCPNCHALYHREKISKKSIVAWKALIVSLNASLSINALDDLLFIAHQPIALELSADGVARFSNLIGSGYVSWIGSKSEVRKFDPPKHPSKGVLQQIYIQGTQATGVVFVPAKYIVSLTDKGKALVAALEAGDVDKLQSQPK